MKLDDPVMTRREALETAQLKLRLVVFNSLDHGLGVDDYNKQDIRTALKMIDLALKED